MSDVPGAQAREPMSRQRWAELEPLVDAALELEPGARRAYCARIASSDPRLGADLERLVRWSDTSCPLLDAAAADRFALLLEDGSIPGETDLLDKIQSALQGTYTLDRELSGGGMSRVFVANETTLGRHVVIKVLTRELAAGISGERFAREIKLAASLQQANIVPLLATGMAGNLPYYTMPFVEGRSLQQRLAREGALPVIDAVSVLRDIARALVFAHSRGVIHRDIKPGNVLLSGGTAVVTDFGIAKAIGAARSDTSGETQVDTRDETRGDDLTGEGASLGTPAYMAPEQAMGDPRTDHRADIYSFGCVAYEMLAGKPPFHGGAVHQIIGAHLRDAPRPIADHRSDVPPAIADLIARCLEKDPANRPQNAAHLLAALDGARVEHPVRSRRDVRRAIVAGFAIVGLALAGGFYARRGAADEPLTVTAIPFLNVARDTALTYRSDGIADEILTSLGKVSGIQIIGRSTARRFAERPGAGAPDVRRIARELGVRFVITGTFLERDGRIQISAQLNDSTTRGESWSGTFDRDANVFGSISDAIAGTIVDTLRARFPGRLGSTKDAAKAATTNNAAWDAYLVGQELLKHRGAGVEQSVASFERAIALDPGFARAYAGLATALQLEAFFIGVSPEQVRERTISAARRALALDTTLADPHLALGQIYAGASQWSRVDAEMRLAVRLEPDNVAALQTYARFLSNQGRAEDGLTLLDHARKVERLSPLVSAWLGYAFFIAGRRDSALVQAARAIQLDSTLLPATNLGALINLAAGRPEVARRLMADVPPVGVMTNAAYVLARLGDTVAATRMVNAMEAANPRPWFTDAARASVFLARGDTAQALDYFERSARATGSLWIQFMPLQDPAFDILRPNPRFAALLRAANLDVGRLTSAHAGRR